MRLPSLVWLMTVAVLGSIAAAAPEKKPPAKKAATPAATLYEGDIPGGLLPILADIQTDNQDFPVNVDTGAQGTFILDMGMAATYGKFLRGANVTGKNVAGGVYQFPEIRVGKLVLPPGPVFGFNIDGIRATMGVNLGGSLGWDSLKGRTLLLDYDLGKMRILDRAEIPSSFQTRLPIEIVQGIPAVRGKLGSRESSWHIDTGSSDGISVSNEEFDRLIAEGVVEDRHQETHGVDVGGSVSIRIGKILKGSLFDIDVTGRKIDTNPTPINSIGRNFLSRLNVAISNTPSTFAFTTRKQPEAPLAHWQMLGALLRFSDNGAVVAGVFPDGPAAKAGVEPGDTISDIDEVGARALDAYVIHDVVKKQSGKSLTLHLLHQGRPRRVVLPIPAPISAWAEN